jgi:hypothetical protein
MRLAYARRAFSGLTVGVGCVRRVLLPQWLHAQCLDAVQPGAQADRIRIPRPLPCPVGNSALHRQFAIPEPGQTEIDDFRPGPYHIRIRF